MAGAGTEPGRARIAVVIPAVALAFALLLGGGGSPSPKPETVLQIILAGLFALWIWQQPDRAGQALPRRARLVIGLALALPLLQLIPLPAPVWQALPGRELEREALALAGLADTWRTWSMAPPRTLAGLLALVSALTLLAMVAASDRRAAALVPVAIVAVGLLTLLLGAAQLSAGPDSPLHFYTRGSPYLEGFQANHNSTADVLLIALIAVPTVLRDLPGGSAPNFRRLAAGTALVSLLALGVVLTGSRAGIALLPLALGGALLIARPWLRFDRRAVPVVLAALAAAGVVAVLLLWDNGAIGRVAARFGVERELRPDLWRDSFYTARLYFPFGSGVGNFVPSMLAAERLELVRETLPNRAHNDYLELAVEGGAVALALLAAVAGLVGTALRRRLRVHDEARPRVIFAAATLAILALHSLVDYPFRSMALACLGAACAGIILREPRGRSAPVGTGEPEVSP